MSSHGKNVDVAVVGGGPSGIGAAVAAGRAGSSVALIERTDILGGAGTVSLINDFCHSYHDGERFVIDGVFGELRERLVERGALYVAFGPDVPDRNRALNIEQYNPDVYTEVAAEMCRDAGVELLMERSCNGVDFDDDGADLALDDESRLTARTVVDATGDAVIAHEADVPTTMGRAEDGRVQPLTLGYKYGPVDIDALADARPDAVLYDENCEESFVALQQSEAVLSTVRSALDSGEIDIPVPKLYESMSVPGEPENLTINFNHVSVDDPTDPDELAAAAEEGRRQMYEAVSWFRENVPGFENVEVVEEARQIGVRESRHIEGRYELTVEDELAGRQFDDAIAQCCAPIDVHAASTEPEEPEPGLDRGEHYDIPLRTLLPASGPPNLVVAGRSISATSGAMASFRMQPAVMAIGEAAGAAAALSAQSGVRPVDVDTSVVRDLLEENGAILS